MNLYSPLGQIEIITKSCGQTIIEAGTSNNVRYIFQSDLTYYTPLVYVVVAVAVVGCCGCCCAVDTSQPTPANLQYTTYADLYNVEGFGSKRIIKQA